LEPIRQLFSPDFMPHGYCYLWDPRIVWLHVISDGLITLSYYCIPVALVYLVRKRRDLPFNWVFWMFGLFILGCGTTHLMEIWTVWHASYLASGVIKAITAAVSVATALALVPLIPKAIALPSPRQVQSLNLQLESQIAERERAYAELSTQKSTVADVRRAEQALRDSQAQISAIVQSAMDAIITWNSEHRIVLFNATAEKMFGCPASEALGQSIERYIPQRFRAAHSDHIRRFAETGVTNRAMGTLGALWGLRANGEEFPIEASISQVAVGGQKLLTVILRDITERQQAEERNARLAAIVDSSDDAIFSKDLSGIITSWNRGAEYLYGYSEAEIVGQPVSMLTTPERKSEVTRFLKEIEQGWRVSRLETVRKRKDGALLNVSLMIAPIRDRQGKVIGASTIAHDITERKRVEEELREKASILDWAQILVRDLNGRIVMWNRGAEKLYGYSKEEAVKELSHQLLQTEFPQPLAQIERELRQNNRWEGELVQRRKDGEKVVVASVWALYRDAKGRPSRILEANTDITERKQAEQALKESLATSESALKELADQKFALDQHAIVAVTDVQGTITYVNDKFCTISQYSKDELIGQNHRILNSGHHSKQFFQQMYHTIASGQVWHGEIKNRARDGSIYWVDATLVPFIGADGKPRQYVAIRADITARKRAEEELAGQAEELSRQTGELIRSRQALEAQTLMLQSVLDSMAEGLVAADEEGKFVIWNPAADKILGRGAADISSRQWTEHYELYRADMVTPFPTDQLPLVRAIRGEASTSEMFVRNPEIEEGTWIEASGGPLKDKQGVVRGGVVAFRDITERKASEREIRRLNDELEQRVSERTAQLQAAKDELEAFTYSVSHDLRAPLRHIAGFCGILMEDCAPHLDSEAKRHLQRIQEGTRRMGILVDELLALARVGRQALAWQPTRLNTLVDDVVTLLKPDTENRQVEWKIADLPQIHCDPTLVRQVFQNLISNALKYSRTRPSAVIEIGHREENGQPTIFVRDNGVGFSMKYADKLFGVFQRLHSAEEFEGTGVGLATVQRIVQKHGGRAWGEAELDQGATFYFTLGPAPGQLKTNGEKQKTPRIYAHQHG